MGGVGVERDVAFMVRAFHSWCDGSSDRIFHGPIELFRVCMCYPVCGVMHIKEPLLLIGKSSPCGGSRFPLSLSERSFTICPTP